LIQTINERFVSTTVTSLDLMEIVKTRDPFANEVAANFSNPVTLMFLSAEGRFISSLNTSTDLTDIHPDTSLRAGQRLDIASPERNLRVFLKHVEQHFGTTP
jgi:hypothetical protein